MRYVGKIAWALVLASPFLTFFWWVLESGYRDRNPLLAFLLILAFAVAPFILAYRSFRCRQAADKEPFMGHVRRSWTCARIFLLLTLPLMLAPMPFCLIAAYGLAHGGSGWCVVILPLAWWPYYAWIAPLLGLGLLAFGKYRKDRPA